MSGPAPGDGYGGAPAHDYLLCGWRIRSVVPLPEVMPWSGDDRPPDIVVRVGSVPEMTGGFTFGQFQIDKEGVGRIGAKGVGNFLIRQGREVIVEPFHGLDMPDFRAWLLGGVLGVLCHQRGILPLHASCVAIDGAAVAFTGRSGAGKSTLAAALVRRGNRLIADDVCAVDAAQAAAPRILPSFPRLKLWEDALGALDLSASDLPRAPTVKRKFEFRQPKRFQSSPVPLRAIYLLSPHSPSGTNEIRPVDRADAVPLLSNDIFRRQVGFYLGRKTALMTEIMRMAALIPVYRLPVERDLLQLDAVAARLEAHAGSLAHADRSGNARYAGTRVG